MLLSFYKRSTPNVIKIKERAWYFFCLFLENSHILDIKNLGPNTFHRKYIFLYRVDLCPPEVILFYWSHVKHTKCFKLRIFPCIIHCKTSTGITLYQCGVYKFKRHLSSWILKPLVLCPVVTRCLLLYFVVSNANYGASVRSASEQEMGPWKFESIAARLALELLEPDTDSPCHCLD